jgi:hypothetical protein
VISLNNSLGLPLKPLQTSLKGIFHGKNKQLKRLNCIDAYSDSTDLLSKSRSHVLYMVKEQRGA